MAQTNVNIRMEQELKKEFENFCLNVGMNMTTAFCIFAKTVVREQKIPFEISAKEPNQQTLQAMKNIENRKNISKRFSSVEELMEDLNA